jgi:hypothetical protein
MTVVAIFCREPIGPCRRAEPHSSVRDFLCRLLAFLLFGVIVDYNTMSPTTGEAGLAGYREWSER